MILFKSSQTIPMDRIVAAGGAAAKAFSVASESSYMNNWPTLMQPRLPAIPQLRVQDYEVKKAEFVKSSSAMIHMPHPVGPEFVFIGQSNAGKSSLVNMLTGNEHLAKVSKKPGKTRTINHFLINRKWMLVDCPGYGYARVSRQERSEMHELTKEFLLNRSTLAQIFLLVDCNLCHTPNDIGAANWLNEAGCPWSLVFTKIDAIPSGSSQTVVNMQQCISAVEQQTSSQIYYVPTSSVTGLGRDALLCYITALCKSFEMPLLFKSVTKAKY